MEMADIEWDNNNETTIQEDFWKYYARFYMKINMILYHPINSSKNELERLRYSISLLHLKTTHASYTLNTE